MKSFVATHPIVYQKLALEETSANHIIHPLGIWMSVPNYKEMYLIINNEF